MPIENERKFLITLDSQKVIKELAYEKQNIIQRYHKCKNELGIRLRKLTIDDNEKYIFTYKIQIKKDLLEIEKEITKEDFLLFWPSCKKEVIKTRYKYKGWDIDYFGDKEIYFAMAEYELGVDEKKIKIPQELKDIILYKVRKKDKSFSNKKLGNIKYAKSLYKNHK